MKISVSLKETLSKVLLYVIMSIFALSACGDGLGNGSSVSTWTPSPTVTATCIPDINLSTPEGWGKSRVIAILYDDRPIVDGFYLEIENGVKVTDPSLFIKTVVPKLLKPGDQISIFQLGYSSFDDAIVSRLFSYTTPPKLFNTPQAPNVIPSNSPVTLTPGFGYVATQNAMTQQAKEILATNAAGESEFRCAVDYWNRVVQETATQWDVIATAEISDIKNVMDSEFELYDTNEKVRDREEPYRTNELYYGGVYYGLSFATLVFGDRCKLDSECILIIVDDLEVYGKNNPDNLKIDLQGVTVIAMMPNCRYVDEPECMLLQQYWSEEFVKYGVQETIYANGIRAESNILNFVER